MRLGHRNKNIQRKSIPRRYDAFFALILVGLLVLFTCFVVIKRRANPAPIDGEVAEWRTGGYRDHHLQLRAFQ
jgi:hypothetical protein